MLLYALTILVSAFLLFQVQPVIAKIILPWFGGSAAVWTVCLLFFQMVLLLGYLYAHALARYLKPRMQMVVHVGLLAVSLAALPIYPAAKWKPSPADGPHRGHSRPAGHYRGAAVFSAVHHRAAGAGVVRAAVQGSRAVPFICALERRVDVRAAELSGAVRAGVYHPPAGRRRGRGRTSSSWCCAASRPCVSANAPAA